MNDRRRAPRRPAQFPIQYRLVGVTQVDDIRDISRTGCFIFCRDPLPLGSMIEVSIPEGTDRLLTLPCEVVRVVWGGRHKGQLRSPGMALRFLELSDDIRRRIDRLINTLREASALRKLTPEERAALRRPPPSSDLSALHRAPPPEDLSREPPVFELSPLGDDPDTQEGLPITLAPPPEDDEPSVVISDEDDEDEEDLGPRLEDEEG